MQPTKMSPISPGDVAWFAWEFSALLGGLRTMSGEADSLDGNTVIVTFDPPGPLAQKVTLSGTKVLALLSKFKAPGHQVNCTVSTSHQQLLTRGFYVACEIDL